MKSSTKVKKTPPKTIQVARWRVVARRLRPLEIFCIILLIVIGVFSYLTNPFVRFSIVSDPFTEITEENGQLAIEPTQEVLLRDGPFVRQLAFVKSGWHIFTGKISGGRKAPETSVEQIIQNIHELRFNPKEPFIISGDHFSVFYPRSLGIFYHSLLDPRTALSEQDWSNRQKIYLKSTAYALEVFAQSDSLSTTIVPIGPKSVVLMNIYAPPSDTLYSLLYALKVMQDPTEMVNRYPYGDQDAADIPKLQTVDAAKKLNDFYKSDLLNHWQHFHELTYDETTGLVKKDVLLSGVKDMSKRQSAFYDNVMYWRTNQLAQELGIIPADPQFLEDQKQRILNAFWLEEKGIFLEDLSERAAKEQRYSSEWIIAYQTGMLDPENEADRVYLVRTVAYIQRNALDQPFGLQYHADQRPDQLYWLVKTFAPEYGSTAIWSNLGQEYSKLLAHLAQVTGDSLYLQRASEQVEAYTFNIKRYRGYPEVYNAQGDFFRQAGYKSVRQTGWVVSYEQARNMFEWTRSTYFPTTPTKPEIGGQ